MCYVCSHHDRVVVSQTACTKFSLSTTTTIRAGHLWSGSAGMGGDGERYHRHSLLTDEICIQHLLIISVSLNVPKVMLYTEAHIV